MGELLIGGHVVARQLAAEGVRCVFTLCGGHIAPIYDGCLRYGIEIVDTRHEQAAVHAADAWSRLTRGCGVAILTAGPGVTDGVTGVANAINSMANPPFNAQFDYRDQVSPASRGGGVIEAGTNLGVAITGGVDGQLDLDSGLLVKKGQDTYTIDTSSITTVEGV